MLGLPRIRSYRLVPLWLVLMFLAASACAEPPAGQPTGVTGSGTPATVGPGDVNDAAVAELLASLAGQGVQVAEAGVPSDPCLLDIPESSRRGYSLPGASLSLFLFPDEESARHAADGFPPFADCRPAMDRALGQRFYQQGELIARVIPRWQDQSEAAEVVMIIEQILGPAFICGPGGETEFFGPGCPSHPAAPP